jgi:hypothetical protein
VTQQRIADVAKKYDIRWYFADLYRHDVIPAADGERLERFLLLTRSDVLSIVGLTRKHRVGQTWDGLFQLLERAGHEHVRDIGIPAATSWAVHLELLPRASTSSAHT